MSWELKITGCRVERWRWRQEAAQSVRVRFNPAHHSKAVLLNVNSVGGLWHVPTRCPECGGPVDIAAASVATHPVCAYCRHSIPCDPPDRPLPAAYSALLAKPSYFD